jgi:glycosyltransferase involved in cell wall biosynthesis
MGQYNGIKCSCLVDAAFSAQVRADRAPIAYYGFQKDGGNGHAGNTNNTSYYYSSTCEDAIRNGKGVTETLAAIIKTTPIDVVVGHAAFGTTFFIKKMLNVPVISYVEMAGYDMTNSRREFPPVREHRFLDVSFKSIVYTSAIHSDLIIVPSQHAKKSFPAELQAKIRVQMEGFPIPSNHFDRDVLRETLGIPGSGPIIGFAGRTLEAMRGFDIFVKIAARLKQEVPDAHFLVIGDDKTIYGNEKVYLGQKSFKQYAFEAANLGEDRFIFYNFLPRDQFIRCLQVMDLFICPLFEGAGNWTLFEAMACGLKILASNCCFIPEVITHGQEGFLFDPYDIDSFVSKSLEILTDTKSYQYLGINAQEKIKHHFSVEKAVKGYVEIINEAILSD